MQTGKPLVLVYLQYLQVIVFTSIILYFGKTLFIPLFFGLLIAIVMYPVSKWLEIRGWNKALAITACLLLVTLVFAALLALLAWQLTIFSEDAPVLIQKLEALLPSLQEWVHDFTGIDIDLKSNRSDRFASELGNIFRSGIQTLTTTLFTLFLVPIYTALIMFHRKVLVRYLQLVVPSGYHHQLGSIIQQTIQTYFKYIKGMIWVYLIVGILNSLGLMALGIKHAILFGMLCAIMTIIPYIGIIVSALLPISVAWIETGSVWYPLGVIAVFTFVQYLEANVIFPKVVGTELNVSTLSILVAIIAGGIIWGVAGMVLFIPFIAILKIISDNLEEWKPLNLLLSRKPVTRGKL